jgi:GGDEF domain-containing protein
MNAGEDATELWPILYPAMRDLGNSLDVDETLELLDRTLRDLVGFDGIAVSVTKRGRMAPLYAAGSAAGAELCTALEAAPDFSGLLELRRVTGFNGQDRELLDELAPKVAAALANALRWQHAQGSAAVDAASGVGTRRALFLSLDAELARCRRMETTLAVLVCRVRCQKAAREAIGARLRESCREYDMVARSEDEFILVLPGVEPEQATRKYWQVRDMVEGAEPRAELQTGAAFYPDDGEDAEDLLAAASQRMRPDRPPVVGHRL